MAKLGLPKQQLEKPLNLIVLSLIGLVLTYALFTRAVDTGSLGQYGLVFLFLWFSIYMFTKAVRIRRDGHKR